MAIFLVIIFDSKDTLCKSDVQNNDSIGKKPKIFRPFNNNS